jgi:hypothetical protein
MNESDSAPKSNVLSPKNWKRLRRVLDKKTVLSALGGWLLHSYIYPVATHAYQWYWPQGEQIVIAIDEDNLKSESIAAAISSGYGIHYPPLRDETAKGFPTLVVEYDHGRRTGARTLADALVKNLAVIGVVGHFDSTQTKEAIQTYCARAGHSRGEQDLEADMPLFMPNDTAPDLVAEARDLGCSAAFRLAPSDDSQARVAAHVAVNLNARRLALFVDQSLGYYSNGLADGIREAISTDPKRATSIVADIAFDGDAGKMIVDPAFHTLDVDMAIVIASPSGAEEVLRQAQIASWQPRAYVFSDSVASKREDIDRLSVIVHSGSTTQASSAPPDSYFLFPRDTSSGDVEAGRSAYYDYYITVGKLLRKAVDGAGWPMTRHRFAESVNRVVGAELKAPVNVAFDGDGANKCVAFHCFKLGADGRLTHLPIGCAGDDDERRPGCVAEVKGAAQVAASGPN